MVWLVETARTNKEEVHYNLNATHEWLDKVAMNFVGSNTLISQELVKLIASPPCDFISMMLCDMVCFPKSGATVRHCDEPRGHAHFAIVWAKCCHGIGTR